MWLCWGKGPCCPLLSAGKKGRWEGGESSSGLLLRSSQGDQPRLGVMVPDFTDEASGAQLGKAEPGAHPGRLIPALGWAVLCPTFPSA